VATVTATLSFFGGKIHFHLHGGGPHAVGAAQQLFQVFQNFRRKDVSQRGANQQAGRAGLSTLGAEQAEQGVVYVG